jgi:hypothetical protein
MLELLIVILLILWLLGYFGPHRYRGNNLIHVLLIIVLVLVLLRYIR